MKKLLILLLFPLMVFSQESTLIGDVNCDGEITSQDASLILQFITNNIEELPCEANMTGLTPEQLQEMIDMMEVQLSINYTTGSGSGYHIEYPEGYNGDPITHDLTENYIVPDGKNLYITNLYSDASAVSIDGVRICSGQMNYFEARGHLPYIASSGQVISADFQGQSWTTTFNGYLVEANIEPITYDLMENYTVPDGKILYITNLYAGDGIAVSIDGMRISFGDTNYSDARGHLPYIASSGQVISADGQDQVNDLTAFNGYLVDEDYFSSSGSGSSNNSYGNGAGGVVDTSDDCNELNVIKIFDWIDEETGLSAQPYYADNANVYPLVSTLKGYEELINPSNVSIREDSQGNFYYIFTMVNMQLPAFEEGASYLYYPGFNIGDQEYSSDTVQIPFFEEDFSPEKLFITKFNSEGELLWAKESDLSVVDSFHTNIDNEDNLYVILSFNNLEGDFFGTSGIGSDEGEILFKLNDLGDVVNYALLGTSGTIFYNGHSQPPQFDSNNNMFFTGVVNTDNPNIYERLIYRSNNTNILGFGLESYDLNSLLGIEEPNPNASYCTGDSPEMAIDSENNILLFLTCDLDNTNNPNVTDKRISKLDNDLNVVWQKNIYNATTCCTGSWQTDIINADFDANSAQLVADENNNIYLLHEEYVPGDNALNNSLKKFNSNGDLLLNLNGKGAYSRGALSINNNEISFSITTIVGSANANVTCLNGQITPNDDTKKMLAYYANLNTDLDVTDLKVLFTSPFNYAVNTPATPSSFNYSLFHINYPNTICINEQEYGHGVYMIKK